MKRTSQAAFIVKQFVVKHIALRLEEDGRCL